MSNPVDIKIAHINKNESTSNSIDKDLVHEVFQRYINDKLKLFYRLQQDWVNRAYKNFNDFDTYLILMYLMNKVYINYSDRFHYMSMEAFYSQDKVSIEKLNLIEISKDLNIPKETIRRKVNYLQSNDIIVRSGKSIFLNSPLANSTSNLELDDISDINLSSLFRSLNAIKISSFFSSSF